MNHKPKKMNYRIKNCAECLHWRNCEFEELRSDYCVYHKSKEDQPPGILKAIRKEKRQMWFWIIFLGVVFLFFGLLFWGATLKSRSDPSYIIYSIIYGIASLFPIWMIIMVVKDVQKELKALNQRKSEWIIEYDGPNNLTN